jgi:large subunit ribosomal protein L31
MKKDIHPKMFDVSVTCTCGKNFDIKSTSSEVHSTLCSNCHPFYTGQQKFVDTAGRIDKFKKKYGSK